jgi:hypothetical protein
MWNMNWVRLAIVLRYTNSVEEIVSSVNLGRSWYVVSE